MPRNYFKERTYNTICDVCGFKFKSDQLIRRWDGLYVCRQDFNVRHPLDFIRSQQRDLTVPWTRPESADQFINVNYIFMPTTRCIAGIAIAGTCQSGRVIL